MNKNVQSKKLIIAFIDLWIASLVIGLVYAITLTTLVAMKIGRLFPYINADTAFDLESNIAFLSIIIPDFRKNPYFLVVYIGIIFFESSFPSWHCV